MKKNSIILNSFKQLLSKYEYFVFDCDGVVWNENAYISETVETINHLHKHNKRVFFLSNVNRSSRNELHKKIIRGGMDEVQIHSVYSASYLAARYLNQHFSHIKQVYLIGRPGLQEELERSGLKVYGGASDDEKRLTINDVHKLEINDEIQAVVCGSDDLINYYKIAYAANVAYKSKLLFGTNFDHHAKMGNVIVPGAYSLISTIETVSEVKAKIIAKPSKDALKIIYKDNKIISEEESIPEEIRNKTLMIGDTIRTDVKFAVNCQIDSLLLVNDEKKEMEFKRAEEEHAQNRPLDLSPIPTFVMNKLKF